MGKSESYAVLTCATLLAVAIGCGDPYRHTNPYDPAVPVTFEIAGPDSLFSAGELAQYSVQSIPAFPDTAFSWSIDTVTIFKPDTGIAVVDGATVFLPTSAGGYMSLTPPLEPATVTISIVALLGGVDTTLQRFIPDPPGCGCYLTVTTKQYRHAGYKSVVLTQRLVRIQAGCPAARVCDTLAVGGVWSVSVNGFDALGGGIVPNAKSRANPASAPPVATFVSRDTTIASVAPVGIRAASATARKSGTTWLVAARGALLDSLQLVVR